MVSLLTYPYSEGFLERVYKKRFCFVLNGFSLSLFLVCLKDLQREVKHHKYIIFANLALTNINKANEHLNSSNSTCTLNFTTT